MRRKWVLMGLTVAAVGEVLSYLRFPWHSKAVTQAEVQALTVQLASLFASRQHSLGSGGAANTQPLLAAGFTPNSLRCPAKYAPPSGNGEVSRCVQPCLYLCRQTWHELLTRDRCVQGDSPALVF